MAINHPRFRDAIQAWPAHPQPPSRFPVLTLAESARVKSPPELFVADVELQRRRHRAELAQGAGLELAHALARDAEPDADLLERPRLLPVQPEAKRQHVAHARVQPEQRLRQLDRAKLLRRRLVGLVGVDVLDQVGVDALAVADRELEA